MRDTNSDIIQAALDILTGGNQLSRILVQRKGRRAAVWYGRLTGLGSVGSDATITLADLRVLADDQPFIHGQVIFDVNDVLELAPIPEGASS